ncbi:MAG: aldo/keto reductase, partial [Hydrogenobaculum sp.]
MIEKIALGTVQFGLDYGINNPYGKIKEDEVFRILDFAKEHRIDTLDTAYLYGDSEKVLGKYTHI